LIHRLKFPASQDVSVLVEHCHQGVADDLHDHVDRDAGVEGVGNEGVPGIMEPEATVDPRLLTGYLKPDPDVMVGLPVWASEEILSVDALRNQREV
jgi:hypothetical protein